MHVRHEVLNVHFGVLHEHAQWHFEKAGVETGHDIDALRLRRHNYRGG
jgi:hypothetical protein